MASRAMSLLIAAAASAIALSSAAVQQPVQVRGPVLQIVVVCLLVLAARGVLFLLLLTRSLLSAGHACAPASHRLPGQAVRTLGRHLPNVAPDKHRAYQDRVLLPVDWCAAARNSATAQRLDCHTRCRTRQMSLLDRAELGG